MEKLPFLIRFLCLYLCFLFFTALYIGFCHSFDIMSNTPHKIYYVATTIGEWPILCFNIATVTVTVVNCNHILYNCLKECTLGITIEVIVAIGIVL